MYFEYDNVSFDVKAVLKFNTISFPSILAEMSLLYV